MIRIDDTAHFEAIKKRRLELMKLAGLKTKAGFNPNQSRNPDGTWGSGGRIANEEEIAIDEYVNGGFEPVNQYLRHNKSIDNWYSMAKVSMDRIIKYLNSGMKKLENFNGVVYRGLDLGGEGPSSWGLNNKLRTGEITFLSFLSTSTNKSFPNDLLEGGRGGGKYLFEIASKTGKVLGNYGIKGESEILYPPNTTFLVDSFEKIEGIFNVKLIEK